LHQIAASVKQAAPNSQIVANSSAMQACVASMAQKDDAYTKSNAKVEQSKNQLKLDTASDTECRSELIGDIRTMVTLTQNVAKSPADVHQVGLPPAGPRPPKNQAPTVPEHIVEKPPKRGHGRTVVSVEETGNTRHQFVAQQSLDGGVTWTQLGVGHGKTRAVTGPSGTKVWVRFAMVRAEAQSDWSAALQITIP
jgi:hypothetical protein